MGCFLNSRAKRTLPFLVKSISQINSAITAYKVQTINNHQSHLNIVIFQNTNYISAKMKVKEFRIPLHMSVDEYQIAQNWSVNEQSRRETGGGEGVEIRENKPFTGMSFLDGKYTSGQYTYKIYKVETKLPKFLRYDLFSIKT